jgi:hypothetical protein
MKGLFTVSPPPENTQRFETIHEAIDVITRCISIARFMTEFLPCFINRDAGARALEPPMERVYRLLS